MIWNCFLVEIESLSLQVLMLARSRSPYLSLPQNLNLRRLRHSRSNLEASTARGSAPLLDISYATFFQFVLKPFLNQIIKSCYLSSFLYQSDEDEPDVDSDFDDGSFSVSDGSNRSSRPKKKPKSSKKKKKGLYGKKKIYSSISILVLGKHFGTHKLLQMFVCIKTEMEVKAKRKTASQLLRARSYQAICIVRKHAWLTKSGLLTLRA